MGRIVCALFIALATSTSFAGPVVSDSTLFDFEEFPAGVGQFAQDRDTATSTKSGLTVTITRAGGARFSLTDDLGVLPPQIAPPASWQGRSLSAFLPTGSDYSTNGGAFIANFSTPIIGASIEFGDFGVDSDTPVTFFAWSGLDGAGTVLASYSLNWPLDADLSLGSVGVIGGSWSGGAQSVTFSSGGPFPQSVFWDNLTAEVVPAPSPLGLLGLAGATLLRRRRHA